MQKQEPLTLSVLTVATRLGTKVDAVSVCSCSSRTCSLFVGNTWECCAICLCSTDLSTLKDKAGALVEAPQAKEEAGLRVSPIAIAVCLKWKNQPKSHTTPHGIQLKSDNFVSCPLYFPTRSRLQVYWVVVSEAKCEAQASFQWHRHTIMVLHTS